MLQFIKYMFASFLGVMMAIFICFLLVLAITVGLLSQLKDTSSSISSVPASSVLHLKMEGIITERSQDNPWAGLMNEVKTIGLEDILKAIREAKYNSNIHAIYLETGALSIAPASAEEVRDALADFRESGKKVIAYSGLYTQHAYYIATVADQVWVNPEGMLTFKGLAAERTFYKNTLDKLDIDMQFFKVGSYKSAVEPFMNTEMSEENREQTREYLQGIWDYQLKNISRRRNIPVDELQQIADDLALFQSSDYYYDKGLVDEVGYEAEVLDALKRASSVSGEEKITLVSVSDMILLPTSVPQSDTKNEIAVLYAEGEIVSTGTGMSSPAIVEKALIKEIRQLQKKQNVKAVVFRVNSPGGSAYTSDQIWYEIRKLNENTPVIVSMGDYAASGGYYISVPATYIVASPVTITGSIGIFGMIPDISGLAHKLGMTFDVVKTNKHSDMPTLMRPMTEEEKEIMQAYVDRGYETFLSRCMAGREQLMRPHLDSIAQGRVWTGMMAKEIGLVDELGGLSLAISRAAEISDTKKYIVKTYPEKKDFVTRLLEAASEKSQEISEIKEIPLLHYFYKTKKKTLPPVTDYIQARMPEQLVIY